MASLHSEEFKRDAVRIALTSGLTRRQASFDLGIGMSTLNKWVKTYRDSDVVSKEDQGLAKESERLRRENRLLKEEKGFLKMQQPSLRTKADEVRIRRDTSQSHPHGALLPDCKYRPMCWAVSNRIKRTLAIRALNYGHSPEQAVQGLHPSF